jgi:hypothetical protein
MDLAALARLFPGRVLLDGQTVPPLDPALATGQLEQAAQRVLPPSGRAPVRRGGQGRASKQRIRRPGPSPGTGVVLLTYRPKEA